MKNRIPNFELNSPRHDGASVLLARANFGFQVLSLLWPQLIPAPQVDQASRRREFQREQSLRRASSKMPAMDRRASVGHRHVHPFSEPGACSLLAWGKADNRARACGRAACDTHQIDFLVSHPRRGLRRRATAFRNRPNRPLVIRNVKQ